MHEFQKEETMKVYDECHSRGMWRLGRIEELIEGTDGRVHGIRSDQQWLHQCVSETCSTYLSF